MIQEVFGRVQIILLRRNNVGARPDSGAGCGGWGGILAPQQRGLDRGLAGSQTSTGRSHRRAATAQPVLLIWGATWCPPCNQLKATLFNQQEFALLAQSFVAVQVDGDLPGAQKLGTRFHVRGYPTTLLLNGQGQEITRLPGEIEPEQAIAILRLGLAGGRPIGQIWADARAGQGLTRNEWKSLAFYAWET